MIQEVAILRSLLSSELSYHEYANAADYVELVSRDVQKRYHSMPWMGPVTYESEDIRVERSKDAYLLPDRCDCGCRVMERPASISARKQAGTTYVVRDHFCPACAQIGHFPEGLDLSFPIPKKVNIGAEYEVLVTFKRKVEPGLLWAAAYATEHSSRRDTIIDGVESDTTDAYLWDRTHVWVNDCVGDSMTLLFRFQKNGVHLARVYFCRLRDLRLSVATQLVHAG